MSRSKLRKFEEFLHFPNTYTPWEEDKKTLDHWNTKHLPVTLELAAGTGAYTVALAERFPKRFFVGVDIKGARMWTGAKAALDKGLTNVLFLRSSIERLAEFFPPQAVEEIWITFADPFLAKGQAKKRLTSERFLQLYADILLPGGCLHLKTDSQPLFAFSEETLNTWVRPDGTRFVIEKHLPDVYHMSEPPALLTEIQTTYEKKHLAEGRTISYLQARRT